jgi:hypothetical protein
MPITEARYTFEERLLLKTLATSGPQDDRDCIPERVIVGCGLAERFASEDGFGMIRITAAGQDEYARQERTNG